MPTHGNEAQIKFQNSHKNNVHLYRSCKFHEDTLKGAGSDNTANLPKFYFTHYFILNFIVNQGCRDLCLLKILYLLLSILTPFSKDAWILHLKILCCTGQNGIIKKHKVSSSLKLQEVCKTLLLLYIYYSSNNIIYIIYSSNMICIYIFLF